MGEKLLVSSPYSTSEHHLDLSTVPETSQQLALALRSFKPITNDYPSAPYADSFNWQEIISNLPSDFEGTLPKHKKLRKILSTASRSTPPSADKQTLPVSTT